MTIFDQYTIDISQFIKSIIYILIGIIVYEMIKKIITGAEKRNTLKKRHHQKRAKTINSLLINIFKYII